MKIQTGLYALMAGVTIGLAVWGAQGIEGWCPTSRYMPMLLTTPKTISESDVKIDVDANNTKIDASVDTNVFPVAVAQNIQNLFPDPQSPIQTSPNAPIQNTQDSQTPPNSPDLLSLHSLSAVLLDGDSGRVLYGRDMDTPRPMASTTKIMTCLIALEHSELTEQVTVKREHLREGSSMYLLEGETLTMEELLYGLMLPSGNDAAECIAAHCGGSGGSAQFVRWMNEKAKALGMKHTSFANPSGLDEMGHSSCALDMARLAAYAMQNPTFARIVSTRTASVGTRTMTNHNKLLASYSGCVGLKTGYTGDAGRTLVTCAERGGMRMIAVTLHDGSDWADHAALYDYGFSAYALSSGAKKGEAYGSVSVDGQSVSAVAAESFRYPTVENEALSVRAELPQTVSAPVRKGQTFGTLVISCGETEVGRVDLVSARSVQAQETKSETSKNKSLAEKLWQFLSAK